MAEAVAKDGSQKAQPEGSAECGAWSGRSWCDCGVQVNTTTHKGASVPLPVPGLCPARPQSGPQPCLGQSSPSPSWGGLCRASCPSTAVCCVEGSSLWSAVPVWHTTTSPTSCGLRQCNGSQSKVSESDQSKPCPAQGCACLWLRTGVSAGTTGQWMWVFGCHTTEAVCLKGLC